MRFVLSLALGLTLVAGCGKVGDPLPPFVRIPEPAADFAVSQNAYTLRFQWTSPARNVDFSASTDLEFAEILADGELLESVPVVAGEAQSFELPVRDQVGISRVYTVRFVTTEDRVSALSNPVEFTAVEVPEGDGMPDALVDQGRIRLTWNEPGGEALASSFHVYRDGEPLAVSVAGSTYDDTTFEAGTEHAYHVVPVRDADGRMIEGVPYEELVVEAVDRTAPRPPSDPAVVPFAGGAFLRWQDSEETDLAGYRVYRTDGGDSVLVGESPTTAFNVAGAESGAVYSISAVDESGNESALSASAAVP